MELHNFGGEITKLHNFGKKLQKSIPSWGKKYRIPSLGEKDLRDAINLGKKVTPFHKLMKKCHGIP